MTAVALRRLPGFAFEARGPVYDEVLPRMDVPVFVGFASSGPVSLPVPVEDVAQFTAVFGADAPLAWDVELGRTAFAQLAPAVRMFFANGGRRCWVVRVTRAAKSNALPVPGAALIDANGSAAQLTLAAGSPGSWADGLALSASLESRRFRVVSGDPAAAAFVLLGATGDALAAGDLLRVTWPAAGVQRYVGVASVAAVDAGSSAGRTLMQVTMSKAQAWFDLEREPGVLDGEALLASGSVRAHFVIEPASPQMDGIAVALDLPLSAAPRPGEVILARFGSDKLMLSVDKITLKTTITSPSRQMVQVTGAALWRRSAPPAAGATPIVERLTLDLRARVAGTDVLQLAGLGLAPGHRRHIQQLPADAIVYGPTDDVNAADWTDAVAPRFPAAGIGEPGLCIPFGVTALPEHELPARPPTGSPLERDGLAAFDAGLFADEALAGSLSTTLLADAEYLRFLAPPSTLRELTGLHTALAIDEATLLAVPDAAQPGWERSDKGEPLPPEAEILAAEACIDDDFVDCGAVVGPGPLLEGDARDADASVLLRWSAAGDAGPFVVEEARRRDWRDAVVVQEGWERTATLGAREAGDYYYRVRGAGVHPTQWSNGIALRVAGGSGWRMRTAQEYRDNVLVDVHRLLLRFCVARADSMAVLSLPEHYREDAAAAHIRLLASRTSVAPPVGSAVLIPPLVQGELPALSYAALYHGWVYIRGEDDVVRALAPDGAACGVIARRANERGAWVAPANELLRGVIALERPAPASRWQQLQQLQINVLRQDARGFTVMSADTLARDADVRPIGVRRLLILLRRVATKLGATYVFEPHDDAFRRMVQRGFEAMLADLFQRGAFAGDTAASAYRVVTGESLNTTQSVDAGRFIVELRVAPSRPLVFLTLRLVQAGERVAVTGA